MLKAMIPMTKKVLMRRVRAGQMRIRQTPGHGASTVSFKRVSDPKKPLHISAITFRQ
jgi:hypothetical protein